MKERKVIVLDTNIVIENPNVLEEFKNQEIVVISKILLDEVDNNKKGFSSKSINCRTFARNLQKIVSENDSIKSKFLSDNHYVQVLNLGRFFVVLSNNDFDYNFTNEKNDDKIVILAKEVKDFFDEIDKPEVREIELKGLFNKILGKTAKVSKDYSILKVLGSKSDKFDTVLWTNDNIMSITATMYNVPVEKYSLTDRDLSDIYETSPKIKVDEQTIADFYSKKITVDVLVNDFKVSVFENQYMQLIQNENCVIGKVKNGILTPIDYRGEKIYGVNARNEEQKMFLDAMMDDNIKVLSCVSRAGSGKSLLAIASALYMIEETGKFNQLLIYKPYIAVRGQEIGFLKGSEEDKVYPAFASLFDSLEFLYNATGKSKGRRSYDGNSGKTVPLNGLTIYEDLNANGTVELDVMTFIRGRSFSGKKIVILDEAQNLSVHEVKTLASRLGEDCKLVLLGDVSQIDSNYLTAENCGISILTDALKGQDFFTTVNLSKSERSKMCDVISNLL